MSSFENATQFFHACESLRGWEGCKQYVAPEAPFSAQCEPLIDVSTVEAYTEWMAGRGSLTRLAMTRSSSWSRTGPRSFASGWGTRMSDPDARLNAALEGRYAIERELGEGGMATVYLADDLKHERKVALKVLKPELAAVVGARP